MGNQDISVELASLQQAVSSMDTLLVNEITSLSTDWTNYLHGIDRSLWSNEDACQAFGNAYVSAVEAYDQVLQGMKKDIVRYRDALDATYKTYVNRDDSVMGEMNRHLAELDGTSAGDDMGRAAYGQRSNLHPAAGTTSTAPTDTSPGPLR